MATTGSFFGQTGMTTAERWREVGRRVENGEWFSDAEWSVFGRFVLDTDGFNEAYGGMMVNYAEYANTMSMLAYFLALEAEDAENGASFDGESGYEPQPLYVIQTADVVAEEEPIQVSQMERAGIGQAAFNGYLTKILDHKPDRRRTWNQKVADGLRKWAHWMEERF